MQFAIVLYILLFVYKSVTQFIIESFQRFDRRLEVYFRCNWRDTFTRKISSLSWQRFTNVVDVIDTPYAVQQKSPVKLIRTTLTRFYRQLRRSSIVSESAQHPLPHWMVKLPPNARRTVAISEFSASNASSLEIKEETTCLVKVTRKGRKFD